MTLDDTAAQYHTAEITLVLADLRDQNRCVLVYGVVELCPQGQQPSPAITSGAYPQFRKSLGDNVTLYAKRYTKNPAEALAFFRNPETESSGLRGLPITTEGSRFAFPPQEESFLIGFLDESGVGAILPRRPTCLRVTSKYHGLGAASELLDEKKDAAFLVIKEALGIDMARFPEHVGALHLCFPNPIVSKIGLRLSGDSQQLLLSLTERPNKSVRGCRIELGNEREPFGQGFSVLHDLDSRFAVIPLPADPDALRFRMFDPSGVCIESYPASGFIRGGFSIETSQMTKETLERTLPDGTTQGIIIETSSTMNGRVERPPIRSPVAILRDSILERELEDLRKNKVVMYFAGGESSRSEATQALRELIGQARHNVTIVDPYLSIDDAIFLLQFVRSGECKVRFLAGRDQLLQTNSDFITKEYWLASELARLSPKFPFSVEARKMAGKGAHDRWLQVDSVIYSLGSSINHFGERTTMLFKLPEKIAREIEELWNASEELKKTLTPPSSKTLCKRCFRLTTKLLRTLRQLPSALWRSIFEKTKE